MQYETFQSRFDKFAEEWMATEINHHVSQTASEAFWKIANANFGPIYDKKREENIKRKIPQFCQLRRRLNDQKLPPIHVETAFKNKETGAVSIVNNNGNTGQNFPRHTHTKLYEQATVNVS